MAWKSQSLQLPTTAKESRLGRLALLSAPWSSFRRNSFSPWLYN